MLSTVLRHEPKPTITALTTLLSVAEKVEGNCDVNLVELDLIRWNFNGKATPNGLG